MDQARMSYIRLLSLLAGILALVPGTVWSSTPATPVVDSVQISQQAFGSHVIFHDDFEDSTSLNEKYIDYDSADGSCVVSSAVGFGGSSRSLRARWQQGQVDAGSIAYMFGRNPAGSQRNSSTDFREIYWRFYVKTSKDWTGNPGKLSRATIIASRNWAQAMIAHLWGEDDAFLEIDPATGIDAYGNLVTTTYNDFSHLRWLGLRKGVTPIYETSRSNTWHCIEAHVKLNTPGRSDGVFEFWVDGNLEASRKDLNWVGSWQDYGINTLMFGNYWNEGAVRAQERYIDNIVLSTKPIGLAPSPVNPFIYKSQFEDPSYGDTQRVFNAQICTAPDISTMAWSGGVEGQLNALQVTSANGSFQGSLMNKQSLAPGTVYYVRVQQVDNNSNSSAWSAWKKFMTEAAQADTTSPSPPVGVRLEVKQ